MTALNNNQVIIVIVSFLISGLLSRPFIRLFHKLKFIHNPSVIDNKIPTMGGIIVMLTMLICLLYSLYDHKIDIEYKKFVWLFLYAFSMGLVGFVNDYLSVHPIKGVCEIKKIYKTIIYILITKGFVYYLVDLLDLSILVCGVKIEGFWLSLTLCPIIMMSANCVKASDEFDGLLSGSIAIISLGFGFAFGHFLMLSLGGASLGFLITNCNRAKLSLGETGSIFAGALIMGYALMENLLIIMYVAALWYIIEGVSCVIHNWYYGITKKFFKEGKKLFRMIPLHNHFKMCGYSEQKITVNVWILTFFLTLIALCLIN